MSTLREAAEEALRWMEHARLHLTIKERMHPDGLSLYDSAAEALRAALAKPKTELRDQHKAFTHWYFGLRGINEANFSPEDLAWDAWKAALSAPDVPDVLDELPMPPAGHPLYKLGDRLAHYLDDDKFNECERLLLEGWNHDRIDRKTGEDWLDIEPPEEKPVAWQVRWIDPEEGPGAWRICLDPSEADYYANREDHDWRPLYTHPPRDEWRLASEPPEDGRDVVVWCAQERRAVHGMYVRRHPPVVGLVDGWVAPDASELTHWRDVTPPGSDNIHNIRPLYARPPRDEWRLASEPPEDDRSVLVWMPGKLGGLAIGRCSRGNWSPYYLGSPVTHWRDVTPPTEGK